MVRLFNTILYQPILSVLIFIYENLAFGDLGLAIILLTVFIRVILFPLFYKGAKDQALMQRLQPHIKKIQLDHKDNKEEQARMMLALYRKHRLNPFSGIFLLLLQLPILIALYQVFLRELTTDVFSNLTFLGLINLGEKSLVLAIIAAALQYAHGKLSIPSHPKTKDAGQLASVGRMMIVMGPALTFIILVNFPAALGVYWATSTLFSLGQQVIINRRLPKIEHEGNDSKSPNNAKTHGV
ncbi:MAG: YidC/Oxa1 family membrane protein insertase [Patescibacteria group bacterium]|nr:YidC/Oxa1 family membrane protein insertase [Patescibacteria group bacterium]